MRPSDTQLPLLARPRGHPSTFPPPGTAPGPSGPSHNSLLGAPDQRLWQQSCAQAVQAQRVFPGQADVAEKIGPCPINGDITVHFRTRLSPDAHGAPMAQMLEYSTNRPEAAFAPLVRHAHGLLDRVEQSLDSADPLRGTAVGAVGAVRRSGQRHLNGVRCTGFTAARRTAAMDLEFQIWIDSLRGHVVRVDFRAQNLTDRHGDGHLNSAFGMRLYRFDQANRWVLAQQTDRVTFAVDAPDLPESGYAERTSSFHDHWVQAPTRACECAEFTAPPPPLAG